MSAHLTIADLPSCIAEREARAFTPSAGVRRLGRLRVLRLRALMTAAWTDYRNRLAIADLDDRLLRDIGMERAGPRRIILTRV